MSSTGGSKCTKKALRTGEEFEHYFNPNAYLARWFSKSPREYVEEGDPWGNEVSFFLKKYYDFFAPKFSLNSARILEFGAGPVIAYLISAASFASDIFLAEYVTANRAAVQKWKDGDSDAHNWKPYFEEVVCRTEGKSVEAATARETELKRKLSNIVWCDARSEDPIGVEWSHEKFDVVCINFCLPSACKNREEFIDSTKKLVRLLKPGGWLVLTGFTMCIENSDDLGWYDVNEKVEGEESFLTLPISEEFVQEAFGEAALSSIHCESQKAASGLGRTSIFHVSGQFTGATN